MAVLHFQFADSAENSRSRLASHIVDSKFERVYGSFSLQFQLPASHNQDLQTKAEINFDVCINDEQLDRREGVSEEVERDGTSLGLKFATDLQASSLVESKVNSGDMLS